MPARNILALDVGDKRIGLAMADTQVRIALPFGYLQRSESSARDIAELVLRHNISEIIVGYPRNQSGEPTQQTTSVEAFVAELAQIDIDIPIEYQDESLTSVQAEKRLGRVKDKGDIDAEAASIILQDFLEEKV